MNSTLVLINLFILVLSVSIVVFMKKHYEQFIDSKPALVLNSDTCSRIMHTGETYPESTQLNDPFRGATCSPACCKYNNSSLSCDKGCICMTPDIQKRFS